MTHSFFAGVSNLLQAARAHVRVPTATRPGEGEPAAATATDPSIVVETSSPSSDCSDVIMEVMCWPMTKDRSVLKDEWLLEVFSPPRIVPPLKAKFGANGISVDLRTGLDVESHAMDRRAVPKCCKALQLLVWA